MEGRKKLPLKACRGSILSNNITGKKKNSQKWTKLRILVAGLSEIPFL